MEKAILDTNFILSCVKQKIDFFEELKLMSIQIIIPVQVISELERIVKSKKKIIFRESAAIALKLIEKTTYKKIDLGKGLVDGLIVKYLQKNKNIILATLDKNLKKRINSKQLIIRSKKKLEIL